MRGRSSAAGVAVGTLPGSLPSSDHHDCCNRAHLLSAQNCAVSPSTVSSCGSDKPAKAGNGPRLTDSTGYRQRAAGLCVRRPDDEATVLLVSSGLGKRHWTIPGGGVELGEQSCVSAARECFEEAGVLTHVVRYIGRFSNDERKHRTDVFVLQVDKELPDWEDKHRFGRQRRWFHIDDALLALKESQRPYLSQLKCGGMQSSVADAPRHSVRLPNAVAVQCDSAEHQYGRAVTTSSFDR